MFLFSFRRPAVVYIGSIGNYCSFFFSPACVKYRYERFFLSTNLLRKRKRTEEAWPYAKQLDGRQKIGNSEGPLRNPHVPLGTLGPAEEEESVEMLL